ALAVPDPEDTVVCGAGEQPDLLAAPHCGRGQFFVDRRLKADVVAVEKAPCPEKRLVEAAERRPAIAGDKAAGVETGGGIALALHDRQAYQGLGTGQVDPTAIQHVFVVERDRRQSLTPLGHRRLPKPAWGKPNR